MKTTDLFNETYQAVMWQYELTQREKIEKYFYFDDSLMTFIEIIKEKKYTNPQITTSRKGTMMITFECEDTDIVAIFAKNDRMYGEIRFFDRYRKQEGSDLIHISLKGVFSDFNFVQSYLQHKCQNEKNIHSFLEDMCNFIEYAEWYV